MRMNKQLHQLMIFIIVISSWIPPAHATAWLDFAQGGQSPIGSSVNVILKKTATCPKNGYLLTSGGGSLGGYFSSPRFVYSLTRDNTPPFAMDYAHSGTISLENDLNKITAYNLPFSIQRLDKCTAGQSIVFRLIGILENGYAGEYTYVDNPTLVIQFFDTLI